jgi:hypothetical protein
VTSVSCPDATNCTATGIYVDSSTSSQVFTTDEASGVWGQVKVLSIPSAVSLPGANITIGCVPGGACTVAGAYVTSGMRPGQVFAATIGADGSIGSALPAQPAMGPALNVTGIACPQDGYCTLIDAPGGVPQIVSEATMATVTLTASASPVTYGSEPAETFTATVSSTAGDTPTGTVMVTSPDGYISPGGSALCTIKLAGGTGSCPYIPNPQFPGGAFTVTGTYTGDASYISTSGTATVTVNKAATTTTATISPAKATFTGKALTVTFSATIASPTATGAGAGAGAPTGYTTVTIDGKQLLNCVDVQVGNGKSMCTSSIGTVPAGRHKIIISYSSDGNYLASTSAPVYLTIAKAKTATGLTLAKPTITYGHENMEKLTVSVSHVGSAYATGKVAVKIGFTTICTISLSKGTGSCTLGATRLRAGTYHLAATYAGDGNYGSSTSTSKTLKVTA